MKGDVIPQEELEYRRSLLRAAANGDVHAQEELEHEFHAHVYSPSERTAYAQQWS